MQAGDIVKLKINFEEELTKLGFCRYHIYTVSMGFKSGLLKIGYIRHDNELDIDFAVFSPFFEVPVKCLELASGKDIIKDFRMMKSKGIMDYIKEDSVLSTPMTYEEFNSSIQSGFDDSKIEEAYETYKRTLESENSAQ